MTSHTLYNVACDFADGSQAHYDGLMMGDLLAVIGTLDNLTIIECSIRPEPSPQCATCGQHVDPLAVFPGGICLDCYKRTPDAHRPITADELRSMWGQGRRT